MKKHNLFPYVRVTLFFLSIMLLYVFWEWGAAKLLVESVHAPVAVEAHFIGSPAPDLKVGKAQIWSKQEFHMSSLRGHPVVLHFWATWCGPCLQELPELLALAARVRPQGFSVITVAVDDSWAKLETFFARYPALAGLKDNTIMVLDPDGKIAQQFGSSRFPETFLINDQLLIDNKFVGPQPWSDPQVEPYLARLRTLEKVK